MEKLITITKNLKDDYYLNNYYFYVYNNMVIILQAPKARKNTRERADRLRFFDYVKNEYVLENFDPKLGGNILNFYINNRRLILLGNGRCKIFDLDNNLEVLYSIKLDGVNRCSFSNDGDIILLRTKDGNIRVHYLKNGEEFESSSYNSGAVIFNDKIYVYHPYSPADIYSMYFNKIGTEETDCMDLNHYSKYDHKRISNSEIKIHDKSNAKIFTINHEKYFKTVDNIGDIYINNNTLCVTNYDKKIHISVICDDYTLKYLGALENGLVHYVSNDRIFHEETNERYSIYSLKEFKNGEINYF